MQKRGTGSRDGERGKCYKVIKMCDTPFQPTARNGNIMYNKHVVKKKYFKKQHELHAFYPQSSIIKLNALLCLLKGTISQGIISKRYHFLKWSQKI